MYITAKMIKNTSAITGGIMGALAVFVLISVLLQHTAHRVLLTGYFPADTKVIVSVTNSAGNASVISHIDIQGSDKAQYVGTPILNTPITGLKLEFERIKNDPSATLSNSAERKQFSLDSIQIPKPYSLSYYFAQSRISSEFSSNELVAGSHAVFEFPNDSGRVTLTSKEMFGISNYGLILGLPTLFLIAIALLIRNSQWQRIPAFSDMSLGNKISSSAEFDTINGLRGLAAILVLLGHAAPGFESLQIGLGLLFVLSGFLLSKPFVIDASKILSLSNWERYITKRLKRILPMYYLFIFVTYVITFKYDTAIRHFLFIQAEGHLWPMTQIFAFYMLLPFILLITGVSYRLHRLLPVLIIVSAAVASIVWMQEWRPFYNGEYYHRFYLYAFLMGVLASYIQYDLIRDSLSNIADWPFAARSLLGVVLVLFTAVVILWSAPMKPSMVIWQYLSQFWVKASLVTIIVLLALNSPKTIYRNIITNRLFRSVGVIGFSFYILHSLGMDIFAQIQANYLGVANAGERGWGFTLGAFCITYFMSVITYSYVERPFFGYRRQDIEPKD